MHKLELYVTIQVQNVTGSEHRLLVQSKELERFLRERDTCSKIYRSEVNQSLQKKVSLEDGRHSSVRKKSLLYGHGYPNSDYQHPGKYPGVVASVRNSSVEGAETSGPWKYAG